MTYISSVDNNGYIQRSSQDAETGFVLASLASGAIMSTLPYFSKPFKKQLEQEAVNNKAYRDAFIKSYKNTGLGEKGVNIINTIFTRADREKIGTELEREITDKAIKAGQNACYIPDLKTVKVNLDKAAISAFHECGHAKNHLMSKTCKLLQMCRKPGYGLAGLMGYVALFTRKKPKGEKRNIVDFAQDNCGKIAFAALLPTVAEEAIASHKGIKMAKEGGLSEALLKNLRKFYGKALLTYAGYAVATGLSVFAAGKIMDIFTRPKKIERNPQEFQLPY